jgi:hypothetical protein
MATMGRYCKAYYVRQLSEYPAWRPNLQQLRPDTTEVDGDEVETARTALHDDDVLYLQENHIVTDGIFLDQHIVFDGVTPEWEEFCRAVLRFDVPAEYASLPTAAVEAAVDAGA